MKNAVPGNYRYDVCLSFAGEQREYVDAVAAGLRDQGVSVFYDLYERVHLWGKRGAEHFDRIYRLESEYCVIFASADYARKAWPTHERRSAQSRALEDHDKEYILPARFDDTEIPGLAPDVFYIDLRTTPPGEFVGLLIEKILEAPDVEHLRAALLAAEARSALSPKDDLTRPAVDERVAKLRTKLTRLGSTLSIESPEEAFQLVEEYVFSEEIRRWPGSLQNADYALGTIRQFLSDPIMISGKAADLSLRAAERVYHDTEPVQGEDEWERRNERVQAILNPALATLPVREEYLFALANIPPEVAVTAAKRGYYRSISAQRGDFWSWNYLLLLAHLGERDALLSILKERLTSQHHLDKAYAATRGLARDVLGDEFPTWFHREVLGPGEDDPWPDGQFGL
ncbi:TIR domain-containing protein [Streptomyces sp. NPDC002838]|uniref:TIR domain-containing protein n=1 Tax=Streptomyces sp. NPDC002838 TaxID=3154436 RepID=UPI0033196425